MTKARSILRGFGYSFAANAVSLFVSLVSALIIPKFFSNDLTGFGMFQIYMFYVAYTIVAQFGWAEGIYLREGGRSYAELSKPAYSSQSVLLLASQIMVAILIIVVCGVTLDSGSTMFIATCLAIDIVACSWRHFFLQILQATGRLREFAQAMISSRVTYLLMTVLLMVAGEIDWRYFVIADVVSRVVALGDVAYHCRNIVFCRPAPFRESFSAIKENISAGFVLMAGTMLGLLTIGIVRFVVQQRWEPAVYGQISLVLNIVNVGLVFISALAMAFYPTFKTMSRESLVRVLPMLDVVSSMPVLVGLCFFVPGMAALTSWLPAFNRGLDLLVWLVPYVLLSSRIQLHLMTYLKVLRLEREILLMNVYGGIAAVVTALVGAVVGSLGVAVVAIVVGALVTSVYGEIRLGRELGIGTLGGLWIGTALMLVFVGGQLALGEVTGGILYSCVALLYCFHNRGHVLAILKEFGRR